VLIFNNMNRCKAQGGSKANDDIFVQRLPWGPPFPIGVQPSQPPLIFTLCPCRLHRRVREDYDDEFSCSRSVIYSRKEQTWPKERTLWKLELREVRPTAVSRSLINCVRPYEANQLITFPPRLYDNCDRLSNVTCHERLYAFAVHRHCTMS